MHVHVFHYAIVSGLRLHVYKFCKRLPAKNETLWFTCVIVSPLLPGLPDIPGERADPAGQLTEELCRCGVHIGGNQVLLSGLW